MAEEKKIRDQCYALHGNYDSELFDCLQPLVALSTRYDKAFARLVGELLSASKALAIKVESGELDALTGHKKMDDLVENYNNSLDRLWEEYSRVVATSRAREDYQRRQAISAAIAQAGRDLAKSSSDSSDDLSIDDVSLGSGVVGHLTSESSSGTNKICYYNVLGSTHTLNVGVAESCPVSAKF